MVKLNYLNSNPHNEFDIIHNSKRSDTRNGLTLIREQVRSRFIEYDRNFDVNQLEQVNDSMFNSTNSNHLKHCYENSTKSLEELKVKIKNNQPNEVKNVCQYCGYNSTDTFDHYLPKEKYPEFSVHCKNLIPCCGRCNRNKNEFWINSENSYRETLNLYRDDLPEDQYLFLDFKYLGSDKIPIGKFYIENKGGIDDDIYQIILNHYDRLKLLDLYNDLFSNSYTQFNTTFSLLKTKSFPVFKQFLQDSYSDKKECFGINNFKNVLLKTFIDNDGLIQEFQNI